MWPFSKREIRQAETVPHKVIDTNACTEVNDGVALLNKLLNIKGYDAMSQSPFFAALFILLTNKLVDIPAEQTNNIFFILISPL